MIHNEGHDNRFRVLVIDDDPSFRTFFLRACTGTGWVALAVATPEHGLGALASFAPHIVFLDLTFPDMDGLGVLSELATRAGDTAVVLISGCDPEVLRSANRIGERLGVRMRPPLQKPVSIDDIRDLLTAFQAEGNFITPGTIAQAINENILRLAYQPKVSLRSGEYMGVEALVRWPVSTGTISPAQFVPVVERDEGLSLRLLTFVLERAAREAAAWKVNGACCAVNMSALCLAEASLPDLLTRTLKGTGMTPRDFVLELTETAALQDPDRVERVLTALRIRGFAVSLDDFGTGHSSLLHLQRLPFNEIKIDRTFVATLLDNPRSERIVRLVINLGQTLGATTVAEGIERPEEASVLAEMACEIGQGFYYARPMDPTTLVNWRDEWMQTQVEVPRKTMP
ncbi:EAL domain-containing response regulator [uncultured Rhodospira sp.]|uniref:EAL domain-containing response regulator n=1 Tax=uncultured Rhodospira sp. TaxID=1936189 RepID=UPI002602E743|nr:EAL domain-containing response regulator [uncultured Rhodospira sp.]